MENTNLSFSVVLRIEELEGKPVYTAECEELGVSDFGDTPQEAIAHLRNAIRLLISTEPEKASALKTDQPDMVTRVLL